MGSFDAGCMISGLPIGWNQKVRMVLIKKSSIENGGGILCHPHSLWSPVAPPIPGTYDDYGRVVPDISATALFNFTLKTLNQIHLPVEQGGDGYRDAAVPDLLTQEHFDEGLRTGRILLKNTYPNNTSSTLTQVMIREDVWKEMLSIKAGPNLWGAPRSLEVLQKSAKGYFYPWYGVPLGSHRARLLYARSSSSNVDFSRNFSGEGFSTVIKLLFFNKMKEALMTAQWTLQEPLLAQLIQGFAELAWVNEMMYSPIRMWHPVSAMGQDHDLEACEVFYKKMLAVTKVEIKKRNEY